MMLSPIAEDVPRMRTDETDAGAESARPELGDVAYELGYRVLPYYAFERFEKIEEMCSASLGRARTFFYLLACKRRSVQPQKEEAAGFRWHLGDLNRELRFWIVEYPPALPVDHGGVSLAERMRAGESVTLAPYFSAIVRDKTGSRVAYFVLGQSPEPGVTTVRRLQPDRQNQNLGPGPEPRLDAFINAIIERGGYTA